MRKIIYKFWVCIGPYTSTNYFLQQNETLVILNTPEYFFFLLSFFKRIANFKLYAIYV